MNPATHRVRDVRLGHADIVCERAAGGVVYARSPHALGPFPATMTERLEFWAARAPDRTFLADRAPDGSWRRLTYGEARSSAPRIGQALIDRGLSAGRPVAILSGNDLEHALLGLGAMYAGVPYAPVSPAYSLVSADFSTLRHVFRLLTPGLVFAASGVQYRRAIEAVVPPGAEVVVAADPIPGATRFSDLARTTPGSTLEAARAAVTADTVVKILFTSGSTATPKGVINTHRMWCSNQEMARTHLAFVADEPPVMADWLPWSHTFGGNATVGLVLYNGGSLYIDRGRPVPGQFEETIRTLGELSPTFYWSVPRAFEALAAALRRDPELRTRFFSRLKLMYYAGAGLSQPVWEELERLSVETCGERILMLTGLGSTETAPHAVFAGKEVNRAGVVGVPAPGVEMKLVPRADKLEARLRGPNITPGYWRQEELTRAAFDEEGFYRLGDAVRFADERDPRRGLVFDGRLAEDFKLTTGTWVSVGPLRTRFLARCAPYVQDVVIAGSDRGYLSALIFPDLNASRHVCPPPLRAAPSDEVLASGPVRALFERLLREFAQTSTGSSNRIARAMLMDEPPSLDAGEITDKGSLNQGAVLRRRSRLVEELYAPEASPRVLTVERSPARSREGAAPRATNPLEGMDTYVTTVKLNGIAVVRIDNPPVNALSTPVTQQLAAGLDAAADDPDVRAIVLTGSGRNFVAGADIKELELAARGEGALPEMHGLLDRIEDSAKPIVIAIHGTALGAGLELAMAGHYRVAAPDARMGLPEVNLGIIPGAGGTQRLPRLVGVAKAIDMCVTGTPISADEALRAGLIDRIVDGDLTEDAVAFVREIIASDAPSPRTRERRDRLGTPESNAAVLAAGRETARRTRRNMQAPLAVVDAIEAAVSMAFGDGCRRERQIVEACLRSDQSKALMHAFFAERTAARAPDARKDARAAEIGTVAIIGAGTMGIGIATACAGAGLQVVLIDVGRDVLDRAIAGIQRNVESAVRRGRVSPDEARRRMARIAPQVGYDACEAADLIIEAVYEDLALKKQVFAEVDAVAKAACVLATNTSTLDVDEIASATRRPRSVVGLHFFSPAHVMRLLEIVRGRATGDDVLATAQALARRLGKVGVVVRNSPGFAGNRVMFPYMYEAQFLVEEGATPEQVDRVLTDWGMAMGIFAVDDLAGLDVAWRVRRELRQFETPDARKPLVADALVEMGRVGQKAGKGWYRYGDDRRPVPDPEVLALIERVATCAGIRRRQISDQEVLERTIYALINEGARVLDEGVVRRSSDLDAIYLTGYGFPPYRGGPMFYADTIGLSTILDRVEAFRRHFGERWAPAPLLSRLAGQRMAFAEFDGARP